MWVEVRIIPLPFSQFNSPNSLFRRISKSTMKIGTVTNKDFWNKSVLGGYYSFNILNQKLEYEFYLKLNDMIDLRRFELELRLRLGKMNVPRIQFNRIEEPTFVIKQKNFYKKFGVFYFVP